MKPAEAKDRRALVFLVARELAPAFRDKFDFSGRTSRPNDPSHFEMLADISFEAAEALVVKFEKLEAEALKKEESHA